MFFIGFPRRTLKKIKPRTLATVSLTDEELCRSKNRGEYARLFLACGNAADLVRGRRLHEQLKEVDGELLTDSYVGNVLVTMYSRCGSWSEAQQAFDQIRHPNVISWSSLLAVYGHDLRQCMRVFQKMQLEGVEPNNVTFVNLLKAFERRDQMPQGRLLHARIVESGYESDSVVGTTLMNMYVKCGSVHDARSVFDRIPVDTSPPWSVLIAGFVNTGDCFEAVRIFYGMQLEGVKPDRITLIHAMKACSSSGPEMAADACRVYDCVLEQDELGDLRVANAALNMFGKCNSLEKTMSVFEMMVERSCCSWNTMVGSCVQHGKPREAMFMFRRMLLDGGSAPDNLTFATVITACNHPLDLQTLISFMTEAGVQSDVVTRTILVDCYSDLGLLQHAKLVFDAIEQRDVVLWNVMLGANWDEPDAGPLLFLAMLHEGVHPDTFSFVSVVDSLIGGPNHVRRIQRIVEQCVTEAGLQSDVVVSNAMISMKARSGRVSEAVESFNSRPRDVVTWNSMLGAFADNGEWQKALNLFHGMLVEGERPNRISLLAAAAAAGSSETIEVGIRIHELIKESGLENLPHVGNSLINMYSKCCSVPDSEMMFERIQNRDVISWTALLVAYEGDDYGNTVVAETRYRQMLQEGVMPSKVTLMTLLNIFGRDAEVNRGRFIHGHVKELGVETDVAIASGLIDFYGQCGCREWANAVFETVPSRDRDVVLWNTMISASDPYEAPRLFHQMLNEGVTPTKVTFVAVLDALAADATLGDGRLVERLAEESGLVSDSIVGNALLNLLRECGRFEDAGGIFTRIGADRCVCCSSWNSAIAASAQRGDLESVMDLLRGMLLRGIDPNNATFVAVLSGCGHGGAVEAAVAVFRGMEGDFGVRPTAGESGCVIDLLSRTGRLQEAEELIEEEGFGEAEEQRRRIWTMLLASCSSHGDGERGYRAAQRLMDLEVIGSSGFVAVANSRRCAP